MTLDTINAEMQEELDVCMSRSALRKVLLRNGFRFRKQNKRRILSERREIVAARAAYLRNIRRLRMTSTDGQFVFLDETWFCQNDTLEKAWLESSVRLRAARRLLARESA